MKNTNIIVLSIVPIYIITYLNPKVGFLAVGASFLLIYLSLAFTKQFYF